MLIHIQNNDSNLIYTIIKSVAKAWLSRFFSPRLEGRGYSARLFYLIATRFISWLDFTPFVGL